MMVYFPVFTIGYFFYCEGTEVEQIRDIYRGIVQEDEDEYFFERMLHSQIFYLSNKVYSEVYEYRERLNEYLTWLKA